MPFRDENQVQGYPPGSQATAGRANFDLTNPIIEEGLTIPLIGNAAYTWMYFESTITAVLDSGIVVHNRLPQVDNEANTLGKEFLDDANFDKLGGGVNLRGLDQYTDIMQRMGHSRYWFRLWGRAIRVGQQIPIPKMKTIGGMTAIPYDKNPQWAYNCIVPGGDYSGTVLWYAQWSLWYTTLEQPIRDIENKLLVDPSIKVNGETQAPEEITGPFSWPDDNATEKCASSVGGDMVGLNGTKNNGVISDKLQNEMTVGYVPQLPLETMWEPGSEAPNDYTTA